MPKLLLAACIAAAASCAQAQLTDTFEPRFNTRYCANMAAMTEDLWTAAHVQGVTRDDVSLRRGLDQPMGELSVYLSHYAAGNRAPNAKAAGLTALRMCSIVIDDVHARALSGKTITQDEIKSMLGDK